MPREQADKGIKPFEFRTGIGGLPALGGMYRSGDPATIPPHRFHLLVNMRRQPQGLVTRPGLVSVFNTGVEECITGLTEDPGQQGGAVVLFPGAEPGTSGADPRNAASFRAVFPQASIDYSEFVEVLHGPANQTVPHLRSPVVSFTVNASSGPTVLSRPFLFRGQAVQFALVDKQGTNTVALIALHFPERSRKAADNCVRSSGGNSVSPSDCSAAAGGPQLGEFFPFQWPVGSAGVIVYFDNPFPATDPWFPDGSTPLNTDAVDQVLVLQERYDDALTGTPGVGEVLYFVAYQDTGGHRKRRLVKWNGSTQTVEYTAIPDDRRVALTEWSGGPVLASAGTGTADFAAIRKEDGTWSTLAGGFLFPGGKSRELFFDRGVTWGGKAYVCYYGNGLGAQFNGFIYLEQQSTTRFNGTEVRLADAEETNYPTVVEVVVAGQFAYAISVWSSGPGPASGYYALSIGDFQNPTIPVLGAGTGSGGVRLTSTGYDLDFTTHPPELWMQNCAGRVLVGGHFKGYSPESAAADNDHHGVYDVTNPLNIFAVYKVYDTDQPRDQNDERFSYGALVSVPADETGGEGFQPS